jgi:hypothetical protein
MNLVRKLRFLIFPLLATTAVLASGTGTVSPSNAHPTPRFPVPCSELNTTFHPTCVSSSPTPSPTPTPTPTPHPLLTDLNAYYTMDEASGTREDSTANANDLTDNNTVASVAGLVGNAADFTLANSENLTLADNDSVSTGDIDYTLVVWVNLKTKAATQLIWHKFNTGAADSEYSLFYNQTGDRFTMRMFTAAGGVVDAVCNNLGAPSIDTWYLLIGWHNATADTINCKANNGTTDSTATSGSVPGATGGTMRLGGFATVYGSMRLDEAAFYKRLLTAGEMTALYNAGAGVTYPFTGVP